MTPTDLSVTEILASAWRCYRKHSATCVIMTLILFAAWAVLELIVVTWAHSALVLNLLAHAAYLVVASGLELGFLTVALKTVDGHDAAPGDMFRSVRRGPEYLIAKIAWLVNVLIRLPLLLVPGIRWGLERSFLGLSMAEGRSSREALEESRIASGGRTGWLFNFFAVLLAINIAGAALLGAGLLVTGPTTVLAAAIAYRRLRGGTSEPFTRAVGGESA